MKNALGDVVKSMCGEKDFSGIVAFRSLEKLTIPEFLEEMEKILARAVELKADKAILVNSTLKCNFFR